MNPNRTSSFPAAACNILVTAAAVMAILAFYLVFADHVLAGVIMLALAVGEGLIAIALRRTIRIANKPTAGT